MVPVFTKKLVFAPWLEHWGGLGFDAWSLALVGVHATLMFLSFIPTPPQRKIAMGRISLGED